MAERWNYRTVEGLLYRLGQPPDAQVSRPAVSTSQRRQPGSYAPASHFMPDRVDVGFAIKSTLDEGEIADVRDHYILGARRHGYQRRARIIKKLVHRLNADDE